MAEADANRARAAETLSRTLAGFRRRGLITVKAAAIAIRDPAALGELVKRSLGEE
ncbi:MAG: helix-turn-helix domain-containing protein [Opitutaceae bacterium]